MISIVHQENRQTDSEIKQGHIPEFEGLRGILAWWVVFCHLCLICDLGNKAKFIPQIGDILKNLMENGFRPVAVFVILSGFVITKTLWFGKSTWWDFVLRRLARIYPAYLFCLMVSIFMLPSDYACLSRLQWKGEANQARLADIRIIVQHPATVSLLNLTLFQGLIPEQFFGYLPPNILGVAWSLTLEWQFYLLAPFFVFLFRSSQLIWFGILLSLGMSIFGTTICGIRPIPNDLTFAIPSFFPQLISLFLLGGASFALRDELLKKGFVNISRVTWVVFILALFLARPHKASILVWLATLTCSVPGFLNKTFGAILRNGIFQYLGKISYSTYLIHMLWINAVVNLLINLWPQATREQIFIMICFTVPPLVLVSSSMIYYQIERRFIKYASSFRRT